MSYVDRECPGIISAFRRRNIKSLLPDAISAKDPMYRKSGSSFDLKCIRSYQPFDDPRSIDWRLFGRTDRAYVKEYYHEENESLAFLVDRSASMGLWDADGYRRCVSSMAYIMLGLGVGVSVTAFGSELGRDPVRARSLSQHYLVDLLLSRLEFSGTSDSPNAYRRLVSRSRVRRIVMFSDFHEADFKPIAPRRGKLILVDCAEDFSAFAQAGSEVDVTDPESSRTVAVSWDESQRRALERSLAARRASVEGKAKRIERHRLLPRKPREALYWALAESLYA